MKKIGNLLNEKFDILLFGATFLFFVYVFSVMPPIADRWMEGIAYYHTEDPWRFLFAQIRWMQIANARIFSNIFSAIVDRNIYVRAIINSLMIVLSLIDIRKICGGRKNKYETIIMLSCLLFFSWGIKQEVYLYATTLYVSSVFLLVRAMKYLFNAFDNEMVDTRKLYILEFFTSVWLENISVMVVVLSACLLLIYYIKNKKIHKELLISTCISILGLAVMYLTSKNATQGRLQEKVMPCLDWNRLFQLFYDNIGLFILCSILMCIVFIKYKRENGNRYLNYLQIFMWIIISALEIILASRQIYSIVSHDPKDYEYVKIVFGWSAFQRDVIENFYGKLFSLASILFPFIFAVGVISYIYCMDIIRERVRGLIYLLMFIFGILIDVVGMQKGNRISYPGIFALVGMICLLLKHLDKMKEGIVGAICVVVFLFSIINAEQLLMTVYEAHEIEEERTAIANLVKDKQRLDEWDYDICVTMPKYDEKKLFGKERLQPDESNFAYDILLKYYGLNKGTKIIFKSEQE